MTDDRRHLLSGLMAQAWRIYRHRDIPGSNVRSFADALRNAWAWLKREGLPPVVITRTVALCSMLQSPIRRSLQGQPYAYTRARTLGRYVSRVGA